MGDDNGHFFDFRMVHFGGGTPILTQQKSRLVMKYVLIASGFFGRGCQKQISNLLFFGVEGGRVVRGDGTVLSEQTTPVWSESSQPMTWQLDLQAACGWGKTPENYQYLQSPLVPLYITRLLVNNIPGIVFFFVLL